MAGQHDDEPQRPPHLPPLKTHKSTATHKARIHYRGDKHDRVPPSESNSPSTTRPLRRVPTTNTLRTFLTGTDAGSSSHHRFRLHHHDDDRHVDAAPTLVVRKTPIFSGLVAPFSILLEVPGLTSPWYALLNSNGLVEQFIPNPVILTLGLSVSLTAAVVANMAIIFRFLEILRPRTSIALAIAGFMLHDIINLVALGVFAGIYAPRNDGLSLSASYYMVCASTATSTCVTISLVLDYVRTKDFRNAGSGLTQLQKGLVLAAMGLLLYLSLGGIVFVYVNHTDFISALYFSTATVLTVGFGDIVPPSVGGKVLVFFYAPIGIVLVALVVASARNTLLETFQAALLARNKERRRRIAERKLAHKEHKRQDRALRRVLSRRFNFGVTDANQAEDADADFAEALVRMENEAAGLPHAQQETMSSDTNVGSSDKSPQSSKSVGSSEKFNDSNEKPSGATAGDPEMQREIAALRDELLAAKRRTEEDFRAFEQHARREAISAARLKLVLAASITIAFWLLGAVAFSYAERWSYAGALWFCFIAMITIGYGDYSPETQLGRGLFVMWGLMGVAVLTILLAVVQDAFGGILHHMLTKSTARLFDRAEAKAHKRRKKKEREEEKRFEADLENKAAQARSKMKRFDSNRKSEPDLRDKRRKEESKSTVAEEDDARRHSIAGHGRDGKQSAAEVRAEAAMTIPSSILIDPSGNMQFEALPNRVQLSDGAAHEVENTLVSTPQKLALAALQTFQHSVGLLRLNDTAILEAMTEVPALRHYYISRQPKPDGSYDEQGAHPEEALQTLQSCLQRSANAEHEKVAKLVVANLEFEFHLRELLQEVQDLKEKVEGFKGRELQRSTSNTGELRLRKSRSNTLEVYQSRLTPDEAHEAQQGKEKERGFSEEPASL